MPLSLSGEAATQMARLYLVLLTMAATAIGMLIRDSASILENVIMLYLLVDRSGGTLWLAVSMITSFVSFLCFNWFSLSPYYSLTVNSYNDVVTLGLLLVTGFFASLQTSNLQAQSRFFRRKGTQYGSALTMSQNGECTSA